MSDPCQRGLSRERIRLPPRRPPCYLEDAPVRAAMQAAANSGAMMAGRPARRRGVAIRTCRHPARWRSRLRKAWPSPAARSVHCAATIGATNAATSAHATAADHLRILPCPPRACRCREAAAGTRACAPCKLSLGARLRTD
eukprot:5426624-Prymnesium_polylepis.1